MLDVTLIQYYHSFYVFILKCERVFVAFTHSHYIPAWSPATTIGVMLLYQDLHMMAIMINFNTSLLLTSTQLLLE